MDYIYNIILWTLALYGGFEIVFKFITYLIEDQRGNDYFVIATKNAEKQIEGVIRQFLQQNIYENNYIKKILIIDIDSKDKTKEIIKILENECEYLKLVNSNLK